MKTITHAMLESLRDDALESPRRRKNLNLHPRLDDPVQRFFNAMEPDTYARPHRHEGDTRWELFIVFSGAASVLVFESDGTVRERIDLESDGPTYGVEIPGDTWHTVLCREPGTVVFEIKQGPYHPLSDKDFADWAPPEGSPDVAKFLAWYREAVEGSRPPRWG
jgi:cupin fold WbuC family metalloprotein